MWVPNSGSPDFVLKIRHGALIVDFKCGILYRIYHEIKEGKKAPTPYLSLV
jgi:hypothetical protein